MPNPRYTGPSLLDLEQRGSCAKVFAYAEKIAPVIGERFSKGDTGGVWTFYQHSLPFDLMRQRLIGFVNHDVAYRVYAYSIEKPLRGSRLKAANSYVADRDIDERRYGGAFPIWHIGGPWSSFSGWHETVDIAFGAHCLHRQQVIGIGRVRQIFAGHGAISDELMQLFTAMRDTCRML